MRGLKMHVDHARWFRDPVTGKLRELDILAREYVAGGPETGAVVLNLAVECKTSTGKPWVAFTAPQEQLPAFLRPTAVSDALGREALNVASQHRLAIPRFFRPRPPVAHGLVRAHSKGEPGDPTSPFAAVSSVVAASRAIGRENAEQALSLRNQSYVHFVVPVIALAGSLYELASTESGDELRPVLSLPVATAAISTWDAPLVWVVREDGFAEFARECKAEFTTLAEKLVPHVDAIVADVRERVEKVGFDRALGVSRD